MPLGKANGIEFSTGYPYGVWMRLQIVLITFRPPLYPRPSGRACAEGMRKGSLQRVLPNASLVLPFKMVPKFGGAGENPARE